MKAFILIVALLTACDEPPKPSPAKTLNDVPRPATVISVYDGNDWGTHCVVIVQGTDGVFVKLSGNEYCSLQKGEIIK